MQLVLSTTAAMDTATAAMLAEDLEYDRTARLSISARGSVSSRNDDDDSSTTYGGNGTPRSFVSGSTMSSSTRPRRFSAMRTLSVSMMGMQQMRMRPEQERQRTIGCCDKVFAMPVVLLGKCCDPFWLWRRCLAPARKRRALADVLPTLHTGDIVLMSAGAPNKREFRALAGSPWDHIGLVYVGPDGTRYIAEVMRYRQHVQTIAPLDWEHTGVPGRQGLFFTPLADVAGNQRRNGQISSFRLDKAAVWGWDACAVRRLRKPLSAAELEALRGFVGEAAGRPYAIAGGGQWRFVKHWKNGFSYDKTLSSSKHTKQKEKKEKQQKEKQQQSPPQAHSNSVLPSRGGDGVEMMVAAPAPAAGGTGAARASDGGGGGGEGAVVAQAASAMATSPAGGGAGAAPPPVVSAQPSSAQPGAAADEDEDKFKAGEAWRHLFCSTFVAAAFQRMGRISAEADPTHFFTPEFSTTGTPRPYCCCAWCCRCAAGVDMPDDSTGSPLFEEEIEVVWPKWGDAWERSEQSDGRKVDPMLGQRLGVYYANNVVLSGEDPGPVAQQASHSDDADPL